MTVVYNVIDPSEWPSTVKGIAQGLGQPLPAYLTTPLHPSVSSRASGLLKELSSSSFLRVTTEYDQVSDRNLLADVVDIVLSTVADLRELVKCNAYGPRPTVPLWSTLIKALGHACSDDISILCVSSCI